MTSLLLRRVIVAGRAGDVRCRDGRVAEVGARLPPGPDDEVHDGEGGALVPGLHDHHVHLLATAAAADRSVLVGPPAVRTEAALRRALTRADAALPAGAWLRAVGYHESVAGPLDRDRLDQLVPGRPVRLQHRSGALWVLNSAAWQQVGEPPGGMGADGWLLRGDEWLRSRLPAAPPPDLAALGRRLAALGVTGVTDATPFTDPASLEVLARAGMAQRLHVTGGLAAAGAVAAGPLGVGPVKLVVDEHDLPDPDVLARSIRSAHRLGRPVAVHCVTRASLVLVLVAWTLGGAVPGDRLEHGAVIPAELVAEVAGLGLTVVTQPHFVAERGEAYARDVDPEDLPHLYRCRSLMEAGVPVAAGSDAPFGSADPWAAVAAAVHRRTPSGRVLGPGERLDPRRALGLFLGSPLDPGGPPRRVRPGVAADLVLLDAPLDDVLAAPSAARVRLTVIGGEVAIRSEA